LPDRKVEALCLWAIRNGGKGSKGIVSMLLGTGKVDVMQRDENGRTPLSWAAGLRRVEITKLLLEKAEVDVDAKD
jgi:ankyrin repeat protein